MWCSPQEGQVHSLSYSEPNGPVSFVAEGYGVIESTEMIDDVEHKVFEVKPINE